MADLANGRTMRQDSITIGRSNVYFSHIKRQNNLLYQSYLTLGDGDRVKGYMALRDMIRELEDNIQALLFFYETSDNRTLSELNNDEYLKYRWVAPSTSVSRILLAGYHYVEQYKRYFILKYISNTYSFEISRGKYRIRKLDEHN